MWAARLKGAATTANLLLLAEFDYYDTADPANSTVSQQVPPDPSKVLHNKVFAWPPTTTIPDATAAVVSEGVAAKNVWLVKESFNQNVAVGTIVGVG